MRVLLRVGGDPDVADGVDGGEVGTDHLVGVEGEGERPVVGCGGEGGLEGGCDLAGGEESGDVGAGLSRDVERGGDGVGGRDAGGVGGVGKERSAAGGAVGVDAGDEQVGEGVDLGLGDVAVSAEALNACCAGGDIDKIGDGEEGVGRVPEERWEWRRS